MNLNDYDMRTDKGSSGLGCDSTNTTAPVGVCFDKAKGKFKAYADVFGVRVRLGSTFMSAIDATVAVNSFKHSIFGSRYPLATFLCYKFDCSFNKALSLIASALVLVFGDDNEVGADCTFPSTVVKLVSSGELVSGSTCIKDGRPLLSIDNQDVADIIFGRTTISQVRSQAHLSYDSVIAQIKALAMSFVRV